MDVRMKASSHAFLLVALLPCAKFICDKRIRGALDSRLKHLSLDIVCQPLKLAARHGKMMADSNGNRRFCFTPLAAYIVDLPEATMLAGVCNKTSPITMASYKQLGDAHLHEFRHGSHTLAQIAVTNSKVSPWNIIEYLREAKKFRLNGVYEPFWRDWWNANPCLFLTPEPLHHWHKAFFDHDLKWCIEVVGGAELDFRMSVIQPRIGFRHFKEGVSRLKQVTGREHREMQRYIVAVIAGAASKEIVTCIRALMDVRYLSQSPVIDSNMVAKISGALQEFHNHKEALLKAGVRRGKKPGPGNWFIPKLELLQSIATSIQWVGAPIQYTADVTEKGHSTLIKQPARSRTNLRDYDPQICRYLDRDEKCRLFDLTTSTRIAAVDLIKEALISGEDLSDDDEAEPRDDHADGVCPGSHTTGRRIRDIFAEAQATSTMIDPRKFSTLSTAFSLNHRPNIVRIAIKEAATLFDLPDFPAALAEYYTRISRGNLATLAIGGRRLATQGSKLPFQDIQVWFSMRVQTKSIHEPRSPLVPQNVQAQPPSTAWPEGRYDTVLACTDTQQVWPGFGIQGSWFLLFYCDL